MEGSKVSTPSTLGSGQSITHLRTLEAELGEVLSLRGVAEKTTSDELSVNLMLGVSWKSAAARCAENRLLDELNKELTLSISHF